MTRPFAFYSRERSRDSEDANHSISRPRSSTVAISKSIGVPREEPVEESWNYESPAKGNERSELPSTSTGC